jgi:hypothetical protein
MSSCPPETPQSSNEDPADPANPFAVSNTPGLGPATLNLLDT